VSRPFELELRRGRDAVAQRRQRHALDVVRCDVVTPFEQRRRASRAHERDPAARPGAGDDPGPASRGARKTHRIVEHGVVHPHGSRHGLEREHGGGLHQGHDLVDVELVADLALGDVAHQRHLVLGRRIVDAHLEEEAVELGLGQGVGAFMLDGVLGREHHEGRLERMRLALDRHLRLLHHLEERRLRLRRRAVDLVGEQQVDEHRAAARDERLRLGVVQGVAGDVCGHEVGRELDSPEAAGDAAGQRAHEERLSQAGYALDQHVTAREQRAQHRVDHVALPHHRLGHLGAQGGGDLCCLDEVFFFHLSFSIIGFFQCGVNALRSVHGADEFGAAKVRAGAHEALHLLGRNPRERGDPGDALGLGRLGEIGLSARDAPQRGVARGCHQGSAQPWAQ
jgi:hypothetical protein